MQGIFLKIFVPQTARHQGVLLHEWLLKSAHDAGIPGGSVFRATAGYGRHDRMHEEHFFELAGDLPLMLEFFAQQQAIDDLLSRLREEKLSLFYIRLPAEGGLTAA